MTAGPIGEAFVVVSPDLRGFSAKLRTELTAAVARVKQPTVKIQFDLHKGSLRAAIVEANKILKTAGVKAKIDFDLQRTSLTRSIAEAKRMARGAKVQVGVDVDRNKIQGATRDFNLLGRSGKQALRNLNQEVFHSNIRLREMANILGGATLPVLVSLASVGVAAFGSLGAAAAGAAAAIAVLPGLIAAALQAVGVIALAFSGIGAAVKAMGEAQTGAGRDAASSARQQQAAADSIKAAQRGVRDALQGVRDAQRDLNDARRDARQGLVDLRLEEVRLSLDQRGAALGIKEAEAELRDVLADPKATNLQRERARLRVEESRVARTEIVRRIALNKAEIRSGVEGSDQVVAAKERQRNAAEQLADAQAALARAQRDAAISSTAAAGGVDKLGQAMSKLSPASQRFARFLFSLKPKLDELRATAAAGFLPQLEAGIARLVGAHFPALRRIVDATARTLGDLADEGSRLMASGPWRRDFETIGRENVRLLDQFGRAGLNLADAFRNIIVAAAPLTRMIGEMTLRWSENARGAAEAGRESGRLGRFFAQAGDALQSLLRIAGNVGATLGAIFTAAFPSGAGLLSSLEGATDKMRELATSVEGRQNLKEFFDKARPAIETVGRLLVSLARSIFEIVVHIKTATERIGEFLDKNPELAELVAKMAALALAMKVLNVAGLVGIVGSLGQLVLLNPPLALAVAAIVALGAAFGIAYTQNKPFRDSVDDLGRKIKETVLPALKSFGAFIQNDVIPALQRAVPFIRDQLVAGLDFLFQALEDNKPQLRLFGRILLEVGKFIAVTLIPALFKLWSVQLRGLFTALGLIVGVLGVVGRAFRLFLSVVLESFQGILDGAAAAFGWMPGIGPKLRAAQEKFREFKDNVNSTLDKLQDRDIRVTARADIDVNKSVASFLRASRVPGFHARGARIPGYGGGDIYPAMLEPGETVIPKELTPQIAGWARRHRIPGFRNGGLVGDAGDAPGVRVTSYGSISPLEEGVARFDRALGALATTLGRRLADVLKGFGATGRAGKVLDFLKAQLGEAYLWGGTGPDRWDCSGLLLKAFGQVGVSLPRVARQQQHAGQAVSRAAARLGDLIYFGNPAHHIGFYLGGDTMLHAPHTGDVVKVSTGRVGTGYRRVLDRGGYLMPGINVVENRTGRPELVPGPGKDHVGRAVSAGYGQGLHVENLIVQPISGRFRLADVATELALQGIR